MTRDTEEKKRERERGRDEGREGRRKGEGEKEKERERNSYLGHKNIYWSNSNLVWFILKIVTHWPIDSTAVSASIMIAISHLDLPEPYTDINGPHIQSSSWDVNKALTFEIVKEGLEKDPEIV